MENVENFHTGENDRHDIQDDSRNERPNNEEEPIMEKHCRRRHRRSRSGRAKCRCRSKSKRRKRKLRLSNNPFIIFYLEMFAKSPCKRVVDVARQAGKKWCSMPEEKKQKYIRLAKRMQCRKHR